MLDPATREMVPIKASAFEGLNFVWNPKFDSLANPAVWLAAAGQVFFTLSIGLGSIHCYASYLRENDDVALTGATTAWTNEFCEVVLGGTILIPIAVAYLGLPEVQSKVAGGSGLSLGFFVFPTLFSNWGWFGPVAGFLWFGLLFFAAITSSLAMGQPIMAFLQTEYKFSRASSAFAFGGLLLCLAVPVAVFHSKTFFDEFDYWAGTFSLVVFAAVETILFAWVFGMGRGWAEMMRGAELKIPRVFYYIIKYITPVFLLLILIGYTFQPEGKVEVTTVDGKTKMEARGWEPYFRSALGGPTPPAWEWSPSSMIGKLMYKDLPTEGANDEETRFYFLLRVVRSIDRLVMVGVFAFFAVLVAIAWRKRRLAGVA
jgi:SNF family Na+-dependent transporter